MHEPWARDFLAFERFIDSLGPKPTPQHTLDRIESCGHYEPGNLRWADKATQSKNRDYPEHIVQPDMRVAHGRTNTALHRHWRWIKYRLQNDRAYEHVKMHEPWINDFPAFEAYIESLGPRPTPQHTLDRIEPTGHYEPGNLRWADKKTQSENRRNNKHRQVLTKSLVAVGEKHAMLTVLALVVERRHGVTWYCAKVRCDCGTEKTVYQKQLVNGRTRSCGCFKNQNIRLGHKALEKPITVDDRTMSMSAWAREKGISKHVIWTRIHVGGWDPARAVTTPVREEASVQVNDESLTLSECSLRHGVPVRIIRKRLSKGWDPLAAVTTPVRAWGLNRA